MSIVQARAVSTALSKAATMSTVHARSLASLDLTTPRIRFVLHVRCFYLLVIVFCYTKIVLISNHLDYFAILFTCGYTCKLFTDIKRAGMREYLRRIQICIDTHAYRFIIHLLGPGVEVPVPHQNVFYQLYNHLIINHIN